MKRIGTTLALTLLIAAAFATLAPGAGAETCGNNALNVNLGSQCASVVELQLLNPDANAKATGCADGAGCTDVGSNPSAPVVRRQPAPLVTRPGNKPQPRVVAAPVVPVVQHTYRINAFDAANGESFYSGDFRLRLPYSVRAPQVSPLEPGPSSFAESWGIPAIPREAVFSLIGGLMLLASAGGLRRMMTTV